MRSSRRAQFQLSDSDSEDLPVIDFSQHGNKQERKSNLPGSGGSSSEITNSASSQLRRPNEVVRGEVFMVSSDSEEEPFIPLAVRLKQKVMHPGIVAEVHESPASSANHNGHVMDQPLPAITTCHRKPAVQAEDNVGACSDVTSRPSANWGSACHVRGGEVEVCLRKRKHHPAEVEAAEQEARRRKAEEQGLRDRLRVEKKALVDAVKAMRPEECIKHMVVTVDPGLLQLEGGGALLTSLHAMGCSCTIEKQFLPRSVSWVRRTPCPQTGELLSITESHTVLQVPVDDFINMVHHYKKEQTCGGTADCSLTSWVFSLKARSSSRSLTLAVIDMEKYFKTQSAKSRQKFRAAVLSEERDPEPQGGVRKKRRKDTESLPEVSRVDLEEAVVHLQLHTGVQVHFHSTWKDFTNYVTMTTKAVSEAPFKREREKTGFSFYLESEWAGGQKVDRAGKGLLQVWKRQIQQLNRVSPDMASAIISAYPSPQLLVQAYGRCRSERDKVRLLSDVLIRRGEGVTSTTRRVGPELSKRLSLIMTSADPQQSLDSMA
ncbi:structure-specific endonuclease subunit EME1 [Brachyhypopomus gauderio]|uniref:structure-specific endonuclease subunit EME1 n=1 Tax=Brachyhypopomus gauderio TaxID=698409 RepID=UPI0040419251